MNNSAVKELQTSKSSFLDHGVVTMAVATLSAVLEHWELLQELVLQLGLRHLKSLLLQDLQVVLGV